MMLFLKGMEPKPLTATERKQLVRNRLDGFEVRQAIRQLERRFKNDRDRRRRVREAGASAGVAKGPIILPW